MMMMMNNDDDDDDDGMLSDEKYAVIDYCARNLLQISTLSREDSPIPGDFIYQSINQSINQSVEFQEINQLVH